MKSFVKYSIFFAGIVVAFWVYRSSAIVSAPTGAGSASQQDLTNLQNTIAKDLNTINDRVSGAIQTTAAHEAKISDLTTKLNKANDDVKKAQDTVIALQKKLDDNNKIISSYIDKATKDLQSKIDNMSSFVEKRFDTINTTLNTNKGDIAALQAVQKSLQQQYGALLRPSNI